MLSAQRMTCLRRLQHEVRYIKLRVRHGLCLCRATDRVGGRGLTLMTHRTRQRLMQRALMQIKVLVCILIALNIINISTKFM